jgi:ABC-type bacteriocin/lantibiotic exporter with double-glycine peptidase domain
MRLFEVQRRSYLLLPIEARVKYISSIALQASMAALDIFGILLFGLIGYLASSTLSGQVPDSYIITKIKSISNINFSVNSLILILLIITIVIFTLKSLFSLILNRKVLLFLAHQQSRLGSELIRKILGSDFAQIRKTDPHNISNAIISGTSAAILNSLGHVAVIIIESLLFFSFLAILLIIKPIVAFFTVIYVISLILLLNHLIGFRVSDFNKQMNLAKLSAEKNLFTTLKLFREIRVMHKSDFFRKRSFVELETHAESLAKDIWIQQIPKYVLEIALLLGSLGLLLVLSVFVDRNEVIQIVCIYLAGSLRLFPSLLRIQNSVFSLRAFSHLAQSFHELNSETIAVSQLDSRNLSDTQNSRLTEFSQVQFWLRNVTFEYESSTGFILNDLSLEIRSGDRIAFTGKSGSGKSTLADIMLGLLRPSSGTVTLNNQEPKNWIESHSRGVAYVPQESVIFSGSIEENICLDNHNIDKERFLNAVQISHLQDFIAALPSMEKTIIGPGASDISGGEKQRIGIARALYQNPQILVMDESTSALDSNTEQSIMDQILAMEHIQIVVAIAHRFSSIKKFNRVLFIEDGKIVGDGNMDFLRENIPSFETLFQNSRIAE